MVVNIDEHKPEEGLAESPKPSTRSESNPPGLRSRHLLRKGLVITGISLLGSISLFLVIAIIYIFIILPTHDRDRKAEIAQQAKVAPQKIAHARSPIEKDGDIKVAKYKELVKRYGVVDKNIASSKADVCYIHSSGTVTLVTSWSQSCYLRYVEGYTTSLTQQQFEQRFLAQNSTEVQNTGPTCREYNKNYGELVFRPSGASNDTLHCRTPNPVKGPDTITGLVTKDEMMVKIIRTYDDETIGSLKNQIWYIADRYYYQEDLGCDTNHILCDNPRPKPITTP